MKKELTLQQIEKRIKEIIEFLKKEWNDGNRCENKKTPYACIHCNIRRSSFCLAYAKLEELDRLHIIRFNQIKKNRQLSSLV